MFRLLWPIIRTLLAVAAAYLALTRLVAPLIDRIANRVRSRPPYRPRSEAAALHRQLFVADLHADPYLWNRDLLKRHSYGHLDVPRLIDGNVTLQTVAVATKVPWGINAESNTANSDLLTALVIAQGWPLRTWRSLLHRALYHAERLQQLVARSPDKLLLVRGTADLDELLERRSSDPVCLGFLLGLEGAHALEGDLDNLDLLDETGFRMLGLAHFFDNEAGGSAHGLAKGGLTPWGRELVRACEDRQIIIDLAHASEQLIVDVCAIVSRPPWCPIPASGAPAGARATSVTTASAGSPAAAVFLPSPFSRRRSAAPGWATPREPWPT
jgi:membrane dipeptidase